jgi:hypothetical protein
MNDKYNYKMNNNSFYNKKIGRPLCGVNNFSKVTVLNVKVDNVAESSMNCDECYCSLDTTIDPTNGNIVQNICRRESGSIDTDAGLYIITVWKNSASS